MGKEYIYGDFHGNDVTDESTQTGKRTYYDTRLEIRGGEHEVQLGMIHPTDDGNYGDSASSGDKPEDLPRAVWGTFSRGALNRMIRELRQARDRAYGKDE